MQEIVILLTGVAGAASAAAYRRMPRGRLRRAGRREAGAGPGAAGRMRSRLGALAAERDILGKAISRVHGDAGLGGRRRDALLAMYQRQLSAVLAKIDRLEEASRYPDLGPVGDALSEMMDQKLSSLDERLHELSARIAAAVPAAGAGAGADTRGPAAGKRGGKRAAEAEAAAAQKQAALDSAQRRAAEAAEAEAAEAAVPQQQEQRRAQVQARAQPQPKQRRREEEAAREGPRAAAAEAEAAPAEGRHAVKPVEITTLTTIGGGRKTFPEVGRPRDAAAPAAGGRPSAPEAPGQAKKELGAAAAAAATAAAASAAAAPRPGPQGAAPPSLPASLPKPRPSGIPDAELEDADAGANAAGGRAADDDDLAAIVADIRSTLSKLEQAEVE